jgi:hypothetical protein
MEEIIYFEINDWFSGRDYPNDETFRKFVKDQLFSNDQYCKEHRICVKFGNVDMSINWCVAAPKSWVMENCPQLLSDKQYTYKTIFSHYDKDINEWVSTENEYTKKYSDFICNPDENGDVYGYVNGWLFPKYCEENFEKTNALEFYQNLAFNYNSAVEDLKIIEENLCNKYSH